MVLGHKNIAGCFLRALLLITTGIWFTSLFETLAGSVTVSTLGIDSDQFLSMAGEIAEVPVPLVGGIPRFDSGFEIRTPAYPGLLALTLLLFKSGVPLNASIILFHTALLILTVVGLIKLLNDWIPPLLTVVAFLVAALPMRPYFFLLLAEWQAFCLLMLFLAACVRQYRTEEDSIPLLPLLLASATALTRPDYIILIPVAAGLLLAKKYQLRSLLSLCFVGTLPILVHLGINVFRFERVTMAPAEGHAFALLSPFSSPEELSLLISHCGLSDVSVPEMQTGLQTSFRDTILLEPLTHLDYGTGNLNRMADAFHAGGHPWNRSNSCLLTVSRELLKAHLKKYLQYYMSSIATLLWAVPLVLLAWSWSSRMGEYRSASAMFLLLAVMIHGIHVLFVSAVNIMHLRYYLPTFCPMIFSMVVMGWRRLAPSQKCAFPCGKVPAGPAPAR